MKKLIALLFTFSLLASQTAFAVQAGKFSTFSTGDIVMADEKAADKAAEATAEGDAKGKKKKKKDDEDCE